MEIFKHVSDSRTNQLQILMQKDMNGNNRLFGGKLMEWIDVVAAVVARRHSNCDVTTVFVDGLQFKEPAYLNNTVMLDGRITYVGKTSMEVRVDTYVEKLDGSRLSINTAYIVLVALDKEEKPVIVPRLILETAEEKAEWENGKKRHELRKARRRELY